MLFASAMTARIAPLLRRMALVLICFLTAIAANAQDGKMVFSSDRTDYNYELYLMNLDGTGVERLTYCGAKDVEPSMSRDGSKVVFVSFRDEPGGEIYSVNVDGTDLRRLTHNRRDDGSTLVGTDSNPTWSPDGTQIAFHSWISGGTPGLYKMNADGTGITRLADATSGGISWSPDGSRITYSKLNGNFVDTWIVDANGANPRFLVEARNLSWSNDGSFLVGIGRFGGIPFIDPANGGFVGGVSTSGLTVSAASLSADATKVIFSASVDIAKSRLYSVNVNGTNRTLLSLNTHNALHPSCGPGKTSPISPAPTGFGRLLLTSGTDLYTMNPTGWDLRRLPRAESIPNLNYQHARWSPDGSRISFGSSGDIYVMDADGTNVRKVTTKPDSSYNYEGPATWSPDGQKLAFHYSYRVASVTHRSIMILSGFDTASPSSFNLTGSSAPAEYWPEWNPQANEILYWVQDDEPRLVRKGADSPVAPELIIASSTDTVGYDNGVWNPTGDRIIFTRGEKSQAGNKEELVMVNADGTNLRYLTEHGFGEALDRNATVSPNSSLTDLSVAFRRNVNGRTFLHTLRRTASSADAPLVNTDFQQLTFDDQMTPDGPFSAPLSLHWGSNFDYTTSDETAPGVTITTPAADAILQFTKIAGTAADPGFEPSGVAIVWVKFQRLSDGKYWNPAGSDATAKWTSNAVPLPAGITGSGPDRSWAVTTDLPSAADAPANAQYRVSAFAIDAAGNAGSEVAHNFTKQEPGTLSFAATAIEGYESLGYVDVVVRREGGSNGAVSVDYSASGYSATEGGDFTGASGTLNFADGETEKAIRITLVQDDVSEGREGFNLSLSNPLGGATIGTVGSINVELIEAPFGFALDAPGFSWSTGSTDFFTTGWWTTKDLSHSGGFSAMVTPSFSGTDSWIETSVAGPGTLTFYWKVSSGANGDRLILLLNGVQQAAISGEVNWRKHTLQIPAGTHTVRWNYSTGSGGITTGQNTAWLDSVQFTAGTGGDDEGPGDGDPDPTPDVKVFAGTYQGLIESVPASSQTSGFVTLKVTKKGAFTGKLNLGRTKIPLQGRIDTAGIATLKAQKKKLEIGLQLDFDESGTGTVAGTATAQNGSSLNVFAYKVPVFPSGQSSPHKGSYTVLLPTDSNQGTGYGTMKVSKTGSAKFALKLPDGTKASHSAVISSDGRWPLYGTFGKRPGALLGWVEFQDIADLSDFRGELEWFTFPKVEGSSIVLEATAEVTLLGSLYTASANGAWILPSLDPNGQATLSLASGALPTPALLDVVLKQVRGGKAPVTVGTENPYRIKLKVDAKKGSFTGSYKLPDSKKPTSFGGVLFQKQERGAGFHRVGGASGPVDLTPVIVE